MLMADLFMFFYTLRNPKQQMVATIVHGIDFDPITGNLWDTENGPAYGDEINLVKPGFNSGWISIQGLWKPVKIKDHPLRDFSPGEIMLKPDDAISLVNF